MSAKKVISEPRWPAFVAMIAASVLYWSLPEPTSLGPSWGLSVIVVVLLIPIALSNYHGRFDIARNLTYVANGAITLGLVGSLIFMIDGIPKHRDSPQVLLRSAIALWITNILVFALWYWKLDAGGPLGRDHRTGRVDSSFLFPQMMGQSDIEDRGAEAHIDADWSPNFMDYLFLAFNTSTAFSPTDTAVLSRWAKVGMMTQSLISLAIVVLIAARAVNIL
ncbi:MAG TPA: hypothetical protein VGD60_05755 [Candidatus Acidoferrales bacterium]